LTPSLPLTDAQLKRISQNAQAAFEYVSGHPQLLALEQRVAALDTGVALAEQTYAPQWGLSASYGYRDDDQLGRDRADLFSVGVSFDVPLFTANRQDKAVMAASARVAALKTEKQLKARELVANLQETSVALIRLQDRAQLFDATLLPQMSAQSESSLTAYNNDNGSFSDAVEARIAELNTKIERLGIAIARCQRVSVLSALLVADRPITNFEEGV
ncbi:MAG: TolC family protein, partial [Litorivicinaceae bacterium]|nr:TolC family protein [Litorivicinaceae bacterium]